MYGSWCGGLSGEAAEDEVDEFVEALIGVLGAGEGLAGFERDETVDRASHNAGHVHRTVTAEVVGLEDSSQHVEHFPPRALDTIASIYWEQRAGVLARVRNSKLSVGQRNGTQRLFARPANGGVAQRVGKVLAGAFSNRMTEPIDTIDMVVQRR